MQDTTAPGFFCCIACPAAAISVWIDHDSSSCRSMPLSSMSFLICCQAFFSSRYPWDRETPHVCRAKVRQAVLGCPARIIPWRCSTRSDVSVAEARGITDQLVKAAGTASFLANSTIGLFGAHFGAPLDKSQEKWPPRLKQGSQLWDGIWRNGRYWDRTSDNLLVRV